MPQAHVNSLAATDTEADDYPAIAYGAGTFVVVWESRESFAGSGLDRDIACATSPEHVSKTDMQFSACSGHYEHS